MHLCILQVYRLICCKSVYTKSIDMFLISGIISLQWTLVFRFFKKICSLYTAKGSLLLCIFEERKITAGALYFHPLMVALSLWDFQVSEAFWRTESLNLTAASDWKGFYEKFSCSDVKYWLLLWYKILLFIDFPSPSKLFSLFSCIQKLLFTHEIYVSFWEHHFPLKSFFEGNSICT